MDNKIKNELFFVACDYLYKEKLVTSQKDLAQKIGISEASFSRIKKGRVVSDETLRKLNESFGSIFNMQYFRGLSTTMLVADQGQATSLHEDDKTPYTTLPQWADSLIDIIAKQIKKNEALNRELRQTISEVNILRDDLQNIIKQIKNQPPK
jgi:transcriptional regulator with XRE-family HTH domain